MISLALTYRCRACGRQGRLVHESPSPTLAIAMECLILLPHTPGAGLIETHECSPGSVGVMDLIGGCEADEPASATDADADIAPPIIDPY